MARPWRTEPGDVDLALGTRDLSASALWTRGSGSFFGWGCPVRGRMLSSLSGLYPPEAKDIPLPQAVTTQITSSCHQGLPRGSDAPRGLGGNRIAPWEPLVWRDRPVAQEVTVMERHGDRPSLVRCGPVPRRGWDGHAQGRGDSSKALGKSGWLGGHPQSCSSPQPAFPGYRPRVCLGDQKGCGFLLRKSILSSRPRGAKKEPD